MGVASKDIDAAGRLISSSAGVNAESIGKVIAAAGGTDLKAMGAVIASASGANSENTANAMMSSAEQNIEVTGKVFAESSNSNPENTAKVLVSAGSQKPELTGWMIAESAASNSNSTGMAISKASSDNPSVTGQALVSSVTRDAQATGDAIIEASRDDPLATADALSQGPGNDAESLKLLGEKISPAAWVAETSPVAGIAGSGSELWNQTEADINNDALNLAGVNFSGVLTKLTSADSGTSLSINDVAPPMPDDREGRTAKRYVQIVPSGFDNEDVVSAYVTFDLDKTWFEQYRIHKWSVEFSRFSEELQSWQPVVAKFVSEDSESAYFSVPVSGFSIWSLTGAELSLIHI